MAGDTLTHDTDVAEEAIADPSHVELADELQKIIDRAGTPGAEAKAEKEVKDLPSGVSELAVSPEATETTPLEDNETSLSFGGATMLRGDLVKFRERDGDENEYQVVGKTIAGEDGGAARLILLRPSGRFFAVDEPKDGAESPVLMVAPPVETYEHGPTTSLDKNGSVIGRESVVTRMTRDGKEVTLKVAYTVPGNPDRVIVQDPHDRGFVYDVAASELTRVGEPHPPTQPPGPPEGPPPTTPQPPEVPPTAPPGPPEGPDNPPVPPGPPSVPPGPPEGPAKPTDPTEAPPGTKLTQEELDKIMNEPLQVGAIDVSKSQEQRAKQLAQERLSSEQAELLAQRQALEAKHPAIAKHLLGRALLGAISSARHPVESVFKQNLFRSATLEKYKYEFLTGDKRGDLQLSEDTIRATVARFGEADEQRKAGNTDAFKTLEHAHEKVLSEEAPDVLEFKAGLVDLIKQRVEGTMSEDDFLAAKDRLIVEKAQWMNVRNGKDGEKIVDAADTIAAAAEAMIKLYEHTKSMELVDQKLASMQLVTGEARIGARAEMKLTRTERTIEALTRNGVISRLVPDQTLAIAVAASSSLVARGMSGTASKVAKWGTLGAGAGISAIGVYSRERLALRQERTTVERQMATGAQAEGLNLESTPVREKLSETIFEMNSSEVILSKFKEIRESIPEEGIDLTSEQAADIFQKVMETKAMLEWGDAEQRDVIRYTSEDKMDAERVEMDMNLILLTDLLRQHYDDQHAEHRPEGVASFADMLEGQKRLFMESRLEKIQGELDKKYDSFSKKSAFKKAATTVVAGAVFGALAKEGIELVSEKVGRLAFLQSATEKHVRPKALENSTHTGFGVERTYPKDWNIKYDSASHGTILDSKGNVLSSADFDPKTGAMTAATVEALKEKNIKVNTELITVKGPSAEFHTSIDEFSTHQPKVQRFWQDNNTSAPRFDLNELDTHVRMDGDTIVVDVRSMAPGGSFHGGRFVDAPSEFSSGNGKLLFSLDKSHQSTPFQWNIDKDGMVRLPSNSTEARNLFEIQNGRPSLKAAYMEVATCRGITPEGVQQYDVLSTVVGKNNMPDVTIYDIPTEATTSRTIITALGEGSTVSSTDTAFLFLPPPLPRYGLEAIPPASQQEEDSGVGQAVRSDSSGGGEAVAVRQPADGLPADTATPGVPGEPSTPEAATTPEVPQSNNKAYTAVTELPIDEAWKRHFEAVAARFETEDAGQDSFWETQAAAARPTAQEQVRRSAAASNILSVVAEADPDFAVDSAELLGRLTSGLESARDMSRLKAELEAKRLVVETDESVSTEEKAQSLNKIKEAEEALANLEAQKKDQAPDTVGLLSQLGDEVIHLRSQGMTDLRDVDMSVLGRMITAASKEKQFSQKDFEWLQTAYSMVEVSRTARLEQQLDKLRKKRESTPASAKTAERLAKNIDDLEQQLSGLSERYAQKRTLIERYQILARATSQARQALRNTVETESAAPTQPSSASDDNVAPEEGVSPQATPEPGLNIPTPPASPDNATPDIEPSSTSEGEGATPEVETAPAA